MALSNRKQVEDLADLLGACADSVHERLMKEIKSGKIGRAEGREIFQLESILRQHAINLYAEAVRYVVEDLEITQKSLMEVVGKAKIEIERITELADFIDLVADLVAFASAACAGKPAAILAAFKEVGEDINRLEKKTENG